jgi:modulator of FtsH protease
MGTTYQPELWRDAYVMLGTAAAALIGLLFVATSLHLDEVVNNPIYRIRARNNSFYLLTLLVEATLILIPQPMVVLGAELIAVTLALLLWHVRNLYAFWYSSKDRGKGGGFQTYTAFRFVASDLIGIAGGICLFERSNWGLYLITASYVLFLGSIIMNAWNIMLGVGQAEKKARAN